MASEEVSKMSAAEAAEENHGLKLIEGGKAATAPKEPIDGENWLGAFDRGTIFLYRRKHSKDFNLSIWNVVHQWGEYTLLGRHHEAGPDELQYVDSKLFSNAHDMLKVLYRLPKEHEQITGEDNDEHHRSD